MSKQEDTRYPYTYSCDLIRSAAGFNAEGTILGRTEASLIRGLFASVLEISDEDLAKKLADYYLKNAEDIAAKDAIEFLKSIRGRSVI
jgi:hypothetical protein